MGKPDDATRILHAKLKDTEHWERLTRRVLDLLNKPMALDDSIAAILQLVKKSTGFEAVAIRLSNGDDYPYYVNDGFSKGFIRAETHLCLHDEEGKVVRDEQGRSELECMCGSILRGRTDPSLPFFTANGSFWTNSSTDLLASTTEKDRQGRTRNRCNSEGYESMALIPLRKGDEIIGLLQLNDRRRNLLAPERIGFLENLGAIIGIVIARARAESERQAALERLRASEERYRGIIDGMLHAFAYCRVIFDQGRPQDFIVLEKNSAVESMIGLKVDVGIRISEAIPGVRESDPEMFEICGRVALTGKPERYDRYNKAFNQWFSVSAYSPEKEHVVFMFEAITERKQAEERLRESEASIRRSHEELQTLTARLINAQEEERSRLARELHDGLNQELAMMALELENMELNSPELSPSLRGRLLALRSRVAAIADDVRRAAYRLHPSILDHLGLGVALKGYCEEFSERAGIRVRYSQQDVPSAIPPDVALCLYRIAQESLRNVARHAGIGDADVVLAHSDGRLRLTVSDAGSGFDSDQMGDTPGLGLRSMMERVRLLEGTLSLESSPGRGTRITAHIPLPGS